MAQNQEFTDFEVDANLDGVEAWGGEARPLPPIGDYVLDVVHVEQKNAKSSGNSMIAVTFAIADEGEYQGWKVYNNYVLTAAAMGRIKQLVVACGGSLDKIRASEIMGARIRASVIHSDSGGGTNAAGEPLAPKTFANVINEQAMEEVKPVETKATAKATTPPIARGNQQPANGAKPTGARRA